MIKQVSRRSLVKGAAGVGIAAGTVGLGAASSVFAAPSVIQSGPVELTLWTSFGSGVNGDAQAALIEDFNASQTDYSVVAQLYENYEAIAGALITGLQTGDAPHVAILSDVWWFRFYLSQSIQDLTPWLGDLDSEDYVESLFIEYARIGGQYAVPFARSTPLFYYNADALEAAGVSEEAVGTWTAFREAAPDIIGGGIETAFLFGNAASYGAWVLQGPTWAFDGAYSTPDFQMELTTEGSINTANFMQEFVTSGNALAVADPQTDFMNGVAAATMASTGSLGTITTGVADKFAIKTAFLPEELNFGCCTGGAGLAMIAGLDETHQAGVLEYMKFATNPENAATWSQTTGYMPVRTSAIASEAEQTFLAENPNAAVAVEQLPLTQPQDSARVFVPNGDQILGRGWEQILVQTRPAEEVWAEVEAEFEPEIQTVLDQLSSIEG